jgi:NAD(P)H-hydrate epimerase
MLLVEGVAYVTAEEMRRVDGAAIEGCGIDVLSLMENAGAVTAILAIRIMGRRPSQMRVACLAGKGNNGGDGLVASRHLHNWGADVAVVLSTARDGLGGVAARQLRSVEEMGIPVHDAGADLVGFDILLDALLGYNAIGAPREDVAKLIRRANDSKVPILAVDIPSGLDPTTGEPSDPCITARATLTLALPKTGFLNPASRKFVGDLYLGDVSIPKRVYSEFSQNTPLFKEERIVRIW